MIKKFESYKVGKPKINDYIVCIRLSHYKINGVLIKEKHRQFLMKNIGQVKKIERNSDGIKMYKIEYENTPDYMKYIIDNLWLNKYEIFKFSENKIDLEIFNSIKDYNL